MPGSSSQPHGTTPPSAFKRNSDDKAQPDDAVRLPVSPSSAGNVAPSRLSPPSPPSPLTDNSSDASPVVLLRPFCHQHDAVLNGMSEEEGADSVEHSDREEREIAPESTSEESEVPSHDHHTDSSTNAADGGSLEDAQIVSLLTITRPGSAVTASTTRPDPHLDILAPPAEIPERQHAPAAAARGESRRRTESATRLARAVNGQQERLTVSADGDMMGKTPKGDIDTRHVDAANGADSAAGVPQHGGQGAHECWDVDDMTRQILGQVSASLVSYLLRVVLRDKGPRLLKLTCSCEHCASTSKCHILTGCTA